MKNSTALIALLLAFSISIEQASAQVSVSNPKEHALLLVDQLRKDGIQSFTESITTTIDIYGHLLPSVDAALMDGLGALFESAVKPPDNVRAIDRRAGAGGSP